MSREDWTGRKIIATKKVQPYGIDEGVAATIDEYVASIDQFKVTLEDGRLAMVSAEFLGQGPGAHFHFADTPAEPIQPDKVTCGLCSEVLDSETDLSPRTGAVVCWKCGWTPMITQHGGKVTFDPGVNEVSVHPGVDIKGYAIMLFVNRHGYSARVSSKSRADFHIVLQPTASEDVAVGWALLEND